MKRHWLISLALLAGLFAAPLAAQETILGQFEGQQGGGNSGTGALTLKGWALADSGVHLVVIQVDGVDIRSALYGRRRPDVEVLHPGYPDSAAPGFGYRLDTTRFSNGRHTVSVKVITRDGNQKNIPGTQEILFTNNTAILAPFGKISTPQENTQIFGTCDPNDPYRRLTPVDGWALDLGMETNDAGIGYVQLMIDNQPFFDTRTGCRFILGAGGFTNCYGLFLPNIERNFPFATNAPNAGFRFVLDTGFLISNLGYVEGQHLFTIRAGDISNQTADIDEISVVFRCIEGIPNEGSFGRIESPRAGVIYAGDMKIQGWALDAEGIDKVRILIDGELVGFARYGADDGIFETRPAVFSQYLGFPDAEAPVFRLVPDFDTKEISNGVHELQVVIRDVEGDRTLIGESTFFVDNPD